MEQLKTVVPSEEDFQTIHAGGFLNLILNHPQVQVFTAGNSKSIVIHIPEHGMVQIKVV